MAIKCMLETKFIYLTFRMFRHISSVVTVILEIELTTKFKFKISN